jgi:hypothetical protein
MRELLIKPSIPAQAAEYVAFLLGFAEGTVQ